MFCDSRKAVITVLLIDTHPIAPGIATEYQQWESNACFTMYAGSLYEVSQVGKEACDDFDGKYLAGSDRRDTKAV